MIDWTGKRWHICKNFFLPLLLKRGIYRTNAVQQWRHNVQQRHIPRIHLISFRNIFICWSSKQQSTTPHQFIMNIEERLSFVHNLFNLFKFLFFFLSKKERDTHTNEMTTEKTHLKSMYVKHRFQMCFFFENYTKMLFNIVG